MELFWAILSNLGPAAAPLQKRVVDNCCRPTRKWRHVLEYVSKGQTPTSRTWLRSSNVDGFNAWELSQTFESWIVDWLPISMYNRREQLAGGELGNGFELWRRLFVENKGHDSAIDYGGIQRLQELRPRP